MTKTVCKPVSYNNKHLLKHDPLDNPAERCISYIISPDVWQQTISGFHMYTCKYLGGNRFNVRDMCHMMVVFGGKCG